MLNSLQIPSQPTYTNYGVAVDFAGAPDDNPLYRGRQQPDVNDNDSSGVGTSEVVNVGLLGLGGVSDVGVAIDQVQSHLLQNFNDVYALCVILLNFWITLLT